MGNCPFQIESKSGRLEVEGVTKKNSFDQTSSSHVEFSEYMEVERRVYDIVQKALEDQGHSKDSFIRMKILLERGEVKIFYRGEKDSGASCCCGNSGLSVDVKITSEADIEQLESYRAYKAAASKTNTKTCVLL